LRHWRSVSHFRLLPSRPQRRRHNPSGVRARRAITTRKEFALKHGLSKRTASEGVGAADAHETLERFPQQPIIAPLDFDIPRI
jgi:hypothetical protein